jgi:hypothetical protein
MFPYNTGRDRSDYISDRKGNKHVLFVWYEDWSTEMHTFETN